MKPDLRDRFRSMRVEIDEETELRHLNAIAEELRNPGRTQPRRMGRRVSIGALVAATILLLLPAAAFAADDAVPGDLLYPVKLATERVLSWIDPNIEAEHRIEELETAVETDAPPAQVAERLDAAEQSVVDRDLPPDLIERLERVRARVRAEHPEPAQPTPDRSQTRDGGNDAEPGGPEPSPPTTSSLAPRGEREQSRDGTSEPTPTTSPPQDRPGNGGQTTDPPRERDRDSGRRDG